MEFEVQFPLLPWALLMLLLVAVFAVGVPRRPAPAGTASWWALAASHDRDLLTVLGAVAGIATIAPLAGVMGATGCTLLLLLTAGVGLPVAIERHRRTNGDLAPYPLLLARVEAEAAAAQDTPDAVKELRAHLRALPQHVKETLKEELRAAATPDVRRGVLVARIVLMAVRSREDGDEIAWVAMPDEQKRIRDSLFRLASAHGGALRKALRR